MRVLIVEDEPFLAEAVRDGLRLEAIAADIAGHGDTALEMLSVNSYDSSSSPSSTATSPDRPGTRLPGASSPPAAACRS
jgi:response regulator RpfG family c-di-GMP phosphodiesterase